MSSSLNPFSRAAVTAVFDAVSREAPEDLAAGALTVDMFTAAAPPRPELGDFAVGCFPAARVLRQPPPALAARVAAQFVPTDLLASAEAQGPFVNFRAHRPALYAHVVTSAAAGALIDREIGAGKTICIDYSSPNISKHLAYHHIRSTVIGHALVNLYRAVGYRVIGINHLGDWGTTHGMLLAAYHRWGAPEPLTITGLNELYVRFRTAMKQDPALEAEGRAWFKRLEDGDPEARALWQRFREVSWAEFEEVYRRLGIEFEEVRGESAFLDDVPMVLDLLEKKNLLAESDGALVIPPRPEDDDGKTPPMLLRKQDGATLYGTRDLAAAIYRFETYRFERSLYVVDRGQALHFKQLFDALARAGFDWADRCAHVPFGLIRLGGKKTGTRTGNVVLLREVLDEAERRSVTIVKDNNPAMGDEAVAGTARAVGLGAVVFANLCSQREKDIDFEWEQVLSTSGDSGPYIQYAHARCASLLERGREVGLAPSADADLARLASHHEWGLARKLLDFGATVARAADGNEPHLVSRYLLDLCAAFSRWYTAGNQDRDLRVLVDDRDVAAARLSLVDATRRVLAQGLGLLGIQAPDVM